MTIVFFKQTSLSAFHLTHDCGMLFDMTRVYLYIVFRLLLGGGFRHAAFSIHFGFAVYWCIGNIKTKKTKKKKNPRLLTVSLQQHVSRLKPAAPSEGPAVLESAGACLQTVLFASPME